MPKAEVLEFTLANDRRQRGLRLVLLLLTESYTVSRTYLIGARCGGQIIDSRWPVRSAALIRESKAKEEKRREERREGVDGWSFISRTGHVTGLTVRGLVPLTRTVCASRFGSGP